MITTTGGLIDIDREILIPAPCPNDSCYIKIIIIIIVIIIIII